MPPKRKALILGVGPSQRDAIEYLKKFGWYVIGCSYRFEGQGLALVDRFELIDIVDDDSLERLARREEIGLVYSVGSDLAMPVVSRIASKLGLVSFVEPETARVMQNKVLFRDRLCSKGINRIAWKAVMSEGEVSKWEIFPAVVKPASAQGQRGVFMVTTPEEAMESIPRAISFSANGLAIIEEFLDGREISANLFLRDGHVVHSIYSNRLVVENPSGGIPRRHELPAVPSETERSETDDLIARMVDELKLENGPVYLQLKLTSRGPRIIEAAPRLDGCHLWRLIKMSTGVDLMDATFKLLAGMKPDEALKQNDNAAYHLNFLFKPPGGVFHGREYEVPEDTAFHEFYYKDGEAVRPVNGQLEKVGYYIQKEVIEEK